MMLEMITTTVPRSMEFIIVCIFSLFAIVLTAFEKSRQPSSFTTARINTVITGTTIKKTGLPLSLSKRHLSFYLH
jgi:uncharacterized membrane protein